MWDSMSIAELLARPFPTSADQARHLLDKLRSEIRRHDRLYYVLAQNEISDLEYDRLMARLLEVEAAFPKLVTADSPSQKVGGEPIEGFVQVAHSVPMLSIDNVYDESGLLEFGQKVSRRANEVGWKGPMEWLAEFKVDGVALSLIYEDGQLIRAVTRGDGRVGDDVTHNARTIKGVPLFLEDSSSKKSLFAESTIPRLLEVRGEAYIGNQDFAKVRAHQLERGEEPFKNSRNATAGSLKLLDPKLCAQRQLRFFAHSLGAIDEQEATRFQTHADYLELFHQVGLPTVPMTACHPSFEAAVAAAPAMMEALSTLDFEVDGLVFKVNNLALRAELGMTSKSPRWIVAYKWERYEAATKVINITVQVGKTGVLTPVADLEPVEIAGTTVSRSSLHNRDEIERLGLCVGDTVVVEKAGKIIPHILRVEEHLRPPNTAPYQFPETCPECSTIVEQDEGGVYIRCPNINCPARFRESLRYFASRQAMDIEGLGTKLVEQLVSSRLVQSISDLYRLVDKRAELLELERLGEKSVDSLLAGLEASRQQPLWRLLTALNIRHVGQRTAQILAARFGSMDRLRAQSIEELSATPEVGEVIAESVHHFFHSEYGSGLIEELKHLGLNLGTESEQQQTAATDGVLSGKTFVVTGTLPSMGREEIEELIRLHGGHAASSVSKKTSFVVAGENAGSKLAKAQSLGVPVINEAEFMKLIGKA